MVFAGWEVLANAGDPGAVLEMGEVEAVARSLDIEVATFQIRRAEDIPPALEAFKDRVQAIYVVADPLVFTHRARLNSLAIGEGLPTMHAAREYVEAGGLMSYGPNFRVLFRRAAELVDNILHGTNPADIPVEQPTKFDLVINLKTARALGLDDPANAARARRRGDRVTRREFITLLGGAAAAWPVAAWAQQGGKLPTIGFLGADASAFSPWTAAFVSAPTGTGLDREP